MLFINNSQFCGKRLIYEIILSIRVKPKYGDPGINNDFINFCEFLRQ